MAWNEPGGGGKDPWGNRGDEQGPPDLDEALRKLQQKLGAAFGGRGGGNARSGPGGGAGMAGMLLILVIALLAWAASGIYIVDEGRRGVVLQFGAYKQTTMPGPHWYPRFIQTVQVVDVESVRSIELGFRKDESLMLTQDENIVDVKFAVQYQVKNARDFLYSVRDPDLTLRQVVESAVREVVGKSKMDFVLTGGRSEVVARAHELVQSTLDLYKTGLEVKSINMQDAQAPEQVQGAFADAVKAREDEQRLKNEAEAYSNDVLPKARGAAARIIEEANGYKARVIAEAEGEASRFEQVLAEYSKAPAITRERLYLDSIESVLTNSSKVVVDTRNGNNLLYLPLDKLMQRSDDNSGNNTATSGSSTSQGSAASPSSAGRSSGSKRMRDDLRHREVR